MMIGPKKDEATAKINPPKFSSPLSAWMHVSKACIVSIGPIEAWKAIFTQIILIIVLKLKLKKLNTIIATRLPVNKICPNNNVFSYPNSLITRVLKNLTKKLAKLVKKIAVYF